MRPRLSIADTDRVAGAMRVSSGGAGGDTGPGGRGRLTCVSGIGLRRVGFLEWTGRAMAREGSLVAVPFGRGIGGCVFRGGFRVGRSGA